MAKKQTRRSISVSRTTYERLKAFCETNNISMSQLVETRVNDFLGTSDVAPAVGLGAVAGGTGAGTLAGAGLGSSGPGGSATASTMAPRPVAPRSAMPGAARPVDARPVPPAAPVGAAASPAHPVPMTSAAARFAVEPPPPIIKPRQDTVAPKPAEKRPEQIFTF